MKILRPLILGAGALYLYRRFFADSGAGSEETQAAQPFSSDQLPDDGGAAREPAAAATSNAGQTDTLTRPTWLDPADAS